jgi:UDP-3-O-[3-hydroxymyristoyl] glucosamine N-acyltransferase
MAAWWLVSRRACWGPSDNSNREGTVYRLRTQSVWASDIAMYLNRDLVGPDVSIDQPHSIGVLSPAELRGPCARPAVCLATAPPEDPAGQTYIVTDNPARDIALIVLEFFAAPRSDGIDPTAKVHPEAHLGRDVHIGAYSVIDAGVEIGDSAFIMSRVTVYGPARIGKGCVIKDGAVIGSEGYGFVEDQDGRLIHAPQLGRVLIAEAVWIGANTTIERGFLEETVIGPEVKLDDLVHIGKGAHIGRGCRITAGAVVAYNVRLGDGVSMGPNASVRENLTVASRVLIGQGSVVVKDIATEGVYAGVPARRR